MALSHVNGVAFSGLSHINGIAKANISAINGITAGFGGGGGGSIPTFVGVGAAQNSLSAITLPLPSGVQADDILIAVCVTNPSQQITITDWTAVAEIDGGRRLTVLWKRAGGSESNPTTNDSGTRNLGQIMAIRGCTTSGSPWDVTASGNTGTSTTASANGATTTTNDCLIVAAVGVQSVVNSTAFFSSWANSDLANINERMDQSWDASVAANGFGCITGEKATAGAYGSTTATLDANVAWATWSGALKP